MMRKGGLKRDNHVVDNGIRLPEYLRRTSHVTRSRRTWCATPIARIANLRLSGNACCVAVTS